jgi:hypothetical protein
MFNTDVKAIIARGDYLFGQRGNLMSFWQDTAENFYPERALFTAGKTPGEDFAAHLQTSYPLIVRRELGNAIAAMLRPRNTQWGTITVEREDRLDGAGRQWLEYATGVQWRAMYDRDSQFVRATKEGDHDFATFGQTVITREINWERIALLYRTWHLKDCAWAENSSGQVDELHIDWELTVRQMCELFPKTTHQKIKDRLTKEPFAKVKCRRVIVPSHCYVAPGQEARKQPFTSLYLDTENKVTLEESGRWNRGFSVPRWQTVSGSPYAYSPAVIAALPDARLIQAMTLTLLEAGEMAVRPPLLGNQGALRSDANVYAGGITWANLEGDQKLSEVLYPIYQEKSGLPLGLDMAQDLRNQLAKAFYLDRLKLPPAEGAAQMTAYETARRLEEWIRDALPLFEPMEQEYNGDLCEGTFEDLMRVGAFGPYEEIPDSIKGAEVRFKFESPLHQSLERRKAQMFLEAKDLVLQATELDPSAAAVLDVPASLRDALLGVGLAAARLRDEDTVAEMAAAQAAEQAAEAEAAQLAAGAQAAEQMGKAKKALDAA